MYKLNLMLLFFISLSSVLISQTEKQFYKILFKSESSISDAMDILYNTYSNTVGDKKAYNLNIERYQFNFKKIVIILDDEPNAEQIHYLNQNNNLVSFELIDNRARNEEFKEFMEKYGNKTKKRINIPQLSNYNLVLKFKFKASPEVEQRFLYELFGQGGSYEKDANELEISIPDEESESFIKKLKENNNVVFVQKL